MIKNLVFSGSGSKLFIHLGCINYLKELNYLKNITTYVGTSGGAIIAFLLSIGYEPEILTELFLKLDYDHIKTIDSDSIFNFFENYGFDNGEKLRRVMRIILKNKHKVMNMTFKELKEKTNNNLVVCVTNINKHSEQFLNYKTHPDLDIIDATLMSVSVPFLFVPRKYNNELFVDGGIICHYPINYLEKDLSLKREETLGILLIQEFHFSKDNLDNYIINEFNSECSNDINTFENFLYNMLGCFMLKNLKKYFQKYRDLTIVCVNDNNGLYMDIDNNLKNKFLKEGYDTAKKYFKNKFYNNLSNDVFNNILNDLIKEEIKLIIKKIN